MQKMLQLNLCAYCMQGLSEPLGALMALAFVGPDTGQAVVHYLLAFVGGIMVSFLKFCLF
jgi:zinc transporter ZupT